MLKIIGFFTLLFVAVVLYACLMAAHTSDELAEEFYRNYLEQKRKKQQKS